MTLLARSHVIKHSSIVPKKAPPTSRLTTWFIDGTQPDKLQVQLRECNVKHINETFPLVMDDLDEFETYLWISGITYGKSAPKPDFFREKLALPQCLAFPEGNMVQ